MFRALGTLVFAGLLFAPPQVRVQRLEGGAPTFDPFSTPSGIKAIVFLFTSTDCPISNRFAPEVRRLATAYAPQGVLFRLVYVNPAEDATAIRDSKHALAKFVGATITPEAVVYAGGRVAYRGRIDDRYVDLGLERPAATTHDLAEALAAVLAGTPVPHPTTQAVGCYIADLAR